MSIANVGAGARARRITIEPGLALWLGIGAVVALAFLLKADLPWIKDLPKDLVLPVNDWFNVAMEWFVATFKVVFRAASWTLEWPMVWLQGLLGWLPWPAVMVGVGAVALKAGGVRLAVFALLAMVYVLVTGYWDPAMNTLAMVGVSVPLSAGLGFAGGILAFKSRRVDRVMQPTLDLMQTVPTFAYLIPILLLFGFGPVVGLIASAIYAAPPMVRNVILGLNRVPSDIVESGRMSGCTPRQLLWWVQVPAALPTILVGLNQTILAALSMVIIASVIGSFADVGWELLSTMRKAEFGQSLLAGLVIVLIAMIFDRTSRGFAARAEPRRVTGGLLARHRGSLATLAGVVVAVLLAQAIAPLHDYPKSWVIGVAQPLNELVSFINTTFPDTIEWFKERILFYFLLPLRSGFALVVKPQTWGFEVTPTISAIYAAVAVGLVLLAARTWSWRAGTAVAIVVGLYYVGTVNVPWLAFMAVVLGLAWQIAGWRVAAFAAAAMAFMLLTGVWVQVMMSVYLCGAAVLIASLGGAAIGIWAARNERVSRVVKPIVDTLQTMPTFVYLIPVIMFFQVGDLPALLAIISYAIAPAIRYTEHGIRNVRADVIEAARCMGTTERQLLWQVQLPLALPEIMLGVNQTIMFGLAMLVVSALVGTKELGQLVYRALTSADPGKGAIAGLSMAFIAIIADRIVQAWSAKKKAALGL
jgi:glycine betaine/proline transport system permease protein